MWSMLSIVIIGLLIVSLSDAYLLPGLQMRGKLNRGCNRLATKLPCRSILDSTETSFVPRLSPDNTIDAEGSAQPINFAPVEGVEGCEGQPSVDLNDNRTWTQFLHWNVAGTFSTPLLRKLTTDEDIINLSTKAISGVAWFAIILGMLGTVGFDTKPLLSIFGIAGFTLGLSLKDVFADVYAGLYLLFTRPFKRGSLVSVAGFTGTVVSMDVRYVRLHNSEQKADVLLPASLVYKSAITIKETRWE